LRGVTKPAGAINTPNIIVTIVTEEAKDLFVRFSEQRLIREVPESFEFFAELGMYFDAIEKHFFTRADLESDTDLGNLGISLADMVDSDREVPLYITNRIIELTNEWSFE